MSNSKPLVGVSVLISSVVLALGLFHGGMTSLYLAPSNPLTKSYYGFVSAYIDPFFSQNWGLFSPEPATSSIRLYVRCKTDKQMSQWSDLHHLIEHKHKVNRLGFHGKVGYGITAITRNLHNKRVEIVKSVCSGTSKIKCAMKKFNSINKKLIKTSEYKQASRFASVMCASKTMNLSEVHMKILRIIPVDFSKRLNQEAKPRVEMSIYPITFINPSKVTSL